jgi:mono/diheme cytochrome c family protein
MRLAVSALWLCLVGGPVGAQTWAEVSALFDARCTGCHSGDYAPLDLSLDSHDAVLRGSENGPVLVTAAPETSPLIGRLRGTIAPRMPLNGPPWLDDAEIARITAWIAAGAPGPVAAQAPAPAPQAPGCACAGS